MRTLFIGNSHTFYNDMPNIFKEICKENGIDMQVAMLTKGGMGFDYHAENEQTRFNILFGDPNDTAYMIETIILAKRFLSPSHSIPNESRFDATIIPIITR